MPLSHDRLDVIRLLRRAGVECYTRREWGSPREADGSYAKRRATHPMPDGPADFHYLHLTVTGDTDLPAQGKAAARLVETYGYSRPPMVSYQDLITNEGRYFQGQDYGTKGTHTVNDKNVPGFPEDLNLVGYALALMQNVGDAVTDIQVDVAAKVFAARELLGLVRRGAPIYPHRKFARKLCPGDLAMARLEEIRRLKDHYVQHGLITQEDWFDMAQMTKDELAQLVKAETREAVYSIKIPAPPGSKAEKHYGKGAKLSLPNAVYWSLAESTDDATEATLQAVAAMIEEQQG